MAAASTATGVPCVLELTLATKLAVVQGKATPDPDVASGPKYPKTSTIASLVPASL